MYVNIQIMRYFVLLISTFFLLTSCGINYHLKKSQKHYNKAILKGYKPLKDTTYTNTLLSPIKLTVDTLKRVERIKSLDKVLIEKVPEVKKVYRDKIIRVVDSFLIDANKLVNYDSTYLLNTGSKVRVKINNGFVRVHIEEAKIKERIYINRSLLKYWPLIIILLAVIIIYWKLHKNPA